MKITVQLDDAQLQFIQQCISSSHDHPRYMKERRNLYAQTNQLARAENENIKKSIKKELGYTKEILRKIESHAEDMHEIQQVLQAAYDEAKKNQPSN